MKSLTLGTFSDRADAEKAINYIHRELDVDQDEISYVYRNTEGEVKEVDAGDVADDTPREGAEKGATAGALIGALAGLATVAGVIPVVGPIFAAGPLVTALGIGGALGTTAAGALTGAAVGGLVGALVNMGVSEERAEEYNDRVIAGDILVAVHAEDGERVHNTLVDHGGMNVETYEVSI